MDVARLGVESELQLPAYATAMATLDPSCTCKPRCGLTQRQILHPLSKNKESTWVLTETTSGPYPPGPQQEPPILQFFKKKNVKAVTAKH